MKIYTYEDLVKLCNEVLKFNFNSPEAAIWRRNISKHIKEKLDDDAYQDLHPYLYSEYNGVSNSRSQDGRKVFFQDDVKFIMRYLQLAIYE